MVIVDNSHGSKCLEIITLQPFHPCLWSYSLFCILDVFIAKRGRVEVKKSFGIFLEPWRTICSLSCCSSVPSVDMVMSFTSSFGPCWILQYKLNFMLFLGLSIYSSRGRLRDHVEVSPCLWWVIDTWFGKIEFDLSGSCKVVASGRSRRPFRPLWLWSEACRAGYDYVVVNREPGESFATTRSKVRSLPITLRPRLAVVEGQYDHVGRAGSRLRPRLAVVCGWESSYDHVVESASYDHVTARNSRRSRLRPLWLVVGRTRLRPRGKLKRLRPRCEAIVCRRIELRRGRLCWSWSYAIGCGCRTVGRGPMCSQAPGCGRKGFRPL